MKRINWQTRPWNNVLWGVAVERLDGYVLLPRAYYTRIEARKAAKEFGGKVVKETLTYSRDGG